MNDDVVVSTPDEKLRSLLPFVIALARMDDRTISLVIPEQVRKQAQQALELAGVAW